MLECNKIMVCGTVLERVRSRKKKPLERLRATQPYPGSQLPILHCSQLLNLCVKYSKR
ncbi:hypothetical protein AG1IA_01670 [Rhizoctonia solani AG-1 IA]|uniref:Uncharacterized protein n=1 Tax=Thanatephorus cucumeris (strain AG1-IA) TaxID=983506 RepID=L8X6P8_THACA|nr:hypothetical protein AG1IA_01670 [Rhizoctonia solani AG-1 IA]